MKKYLLFIFILSFLSVSAQEESKFIDRNNVRSWLNNTGELFSNGQGGFMIKDSEENDLGSTIFLSKLWFGADEATTSIADYNSTHNGGPVEYDSELDKVWKIAGGDIKNMIDDFADGNINSPISKEILSYPAKGNSYYGTKLEDKGYAPFKDLNQDGKYNPYDGDYPTIGEDLGDVVPTEMLFTITHDNQDIGVGVEFTTMMYSLRCDEIPELENAIFTRHTFRLTKSDYEKFHYTIFYDPDIGCHDDDNIGTDVETNSLYSYNSDNEDGGASVICETQFDHVPVQGSTFLNQSMDGTMYFMNTGGGDVPEAITEPNFPDEYFQLMNNIWKDGTPLTKGGIGYDESSDDVTKVVFPGNPNNPGEWVQPFVEYYEINDPRSLANFIKSDAKKGDIITLDAVHHFILDTEKNNIEQVNPFIEQAALFRQLYNNGLSQSCFQYTDVEEYELVSTLDIFPNPNSGEFTLKGKNSNGTSYSLYDITGTLKRQGEIQSEKIQLNSIEPGIYIFELHRDSKTIAVSKVVIY